MSQNLNEENKKKVIGVIKFENPDNIQKTMINKTNESSDDLGSVNDMSENNEDYRTGRWHPTEHYRFIKGCLLHGNNWKKVNILKSYKFLFDLQILN
jgi:hypothetical protein